MSAQAGTALVLHNGRETALRPALPAETGSPLAVMAPGITSDELKELETFCTHLARSGYFKDASQVSQAIVKVLMGRELGLAPMASMTKIYIIEGKPAVGADLLARMIKQSGKYNYRIIEHTVEKCRIEFLEKVDGQWEKAGESEFTIQEAAKAGLQNKNNWKAYPKNMLFARALSNGQKWFAPDATAIGVYTQEEMEDSELESAFENAHAERALVRERPRTVLSQRQLDKRAEAETPAETPQAPVEAQEPAKATETAAKGAEPQASGDSIKQAKNEIAEMFTKVTGLSWKDRGEDFKAWAQRMLGTDKPTRDFTLDDYREIVGRANQVNGLWSQAFDKFEGTADDLVDWLASRGMPVATLQLLTQPEWLRIHEMLDAAIAGDEETETTEEEPIVGEMPLGGQPDLFGRE